MIELIELGLNGAQVMFPHIPFKKEKAKVIRVDKSKGEAVVTLLAAVVPIPVTVKFDNVKVIRREKEETEETEEVPGGSSQGEQESQKPDINQD